MARQQQRLLPAILLLVFLNCPSTAVAKESVLGMNQKVYEVLTEAQELYESNQPSKAMVVLEGARATMSKRLTDYENAHILNMMAAIKQDDGDSAGAMALFEQALQYPTLPESLKVNLYRNIAQLAIVAEDYNKALTYARKALSTATTPDASAHVLAAQAWYYLEKYAEASTEMSTALAMDASDTKPPRENWLLLANAIAYGRKDFQAMLDLQTQLLRYYPRDRYLLNLAAIYGELEQTDKQLALVEALFEGGLLEDGNKLMNLAGLLLVQDVPYKAALIMEKGINSKQIDASANNLDRLGQAWLMAGEYARAIPYLEKAAAAGRNGEGYIRLANTYMALGQWQETADSLKKAVTKGGLNDPGTAHLIRGMALFRLKEYDGARQAFAKAHGYASTEKLAGQWQQYMNTEIARLAAME